MNVPPTYPTDETALFQRIAGGDEAAFRQLFHQYNQILFPFILSLVKSDQDAREIMQEVFLKCWIKRANLPEINDPGAWLYTVASNTAYNYLRSQARYRLQISKLPATEASEDLIGQVDARYTKSLIDEAVQQLPLRRRQVFLLARVEGYSRKEIAAQLGISENTVRNQLVDAVAFVQDYLQKHASLYIPAILICMQHV